MVIGIFVFAFVGQPAWYWLITSRILLLPVIAGIAYELIRYAGKHQDNAILMTLLAPGMWLQRLTTRQPTLDQIEVSIRALAGGAAARGRLTADASARSRSWPKCPGSSATASLVLGGQCGARHRPHDGRVGGAFAELPFSIPSRIAVPQGKTSPEELLAAAHGGCFTTSLASELSKAGCRRNGSTCRRASHGRGARAGPSRRRVGDRHRRTGARGLTRRRSTPRSRAADASCPFSSLLRASASVTVRARLTASKGAGWRSGGPR